MDDFQNLVSLSSPISMGMALNGLNYADVPVRNSLTLSKFTSLVKFS